MELDGPASGSLAKFAAYRASFARRFRRRRLRVRLGKEGSTVRWPLVHSIVDAWTST